MSAVIYGNEIEVQVGSVIQPDGWRLSGKLVASDWCEAEFRLPSGSYTDVSYSVNVKVTGRTFQRRAGDYWVRVQIEFVHDGEPSTFASGWMLKV